MYAFHWKQIFKKNSKNKFKSQKEKVYSIDFLNRFWKVCLKLKEHFSFFSKTSGLASRTNEDFIPKKINSQNEWKMSLNILNNWPHGSKGSSKLYPVDFRSRKGFKDDIGQPILDVKHLDLSCRIITENCW